MKVLIVVSALALLASAFGVPIAEKQPLVVKTQVGTGPEKVHVVSEVDDIDDVVVAEAKKAVDPHGLLDDDVVEDLVDPHDVLEDAVEKAVRPLKVAEEAREDAVDRLEDALSRERDILEDARSAEEDRRENLKDAAEYAIERKLDPSGRLGVDVDIVDPRDPDDWDDLHEVDDDSGERDVKVILTDKGPKTITKPLLTKPITAGNEVSPSISAAVAALKEAKIQEKTRDALEDFHEDARELAEDLREIERLKQS
ncbi:hypothetical protein CHUAL_005205 [Chamberlinius hualienensis]